MKVLEVLSDLLNFSVINFIIIFINAGPRFYFGWAKRGESAEVPAEHLQAAVQVQGRHKQGGVQLPGPGGTTGPGILLQPHHR